MKTPTHHRLRARGAVIVMVVLAGTVLFGAASAGAATKTRGPAPAPQLSIAIGDGQTSTKVGDQLGYEIVVDNLGTDPVTDLVVTQSMPQGLDFATADSGGALARGVVTWHVRVPVGGHATVHASAQVSATPAETLRLASVACATTKAGKPPVVCASHSDQLPAGAAAARAAGPAASGHDQNSGVGGASWAPWALGGGLALLLGGWAALSLGRRRRVPALSHRA